MDGIEAAFTDGSDQITVLVSLAASTHPVLHYTEEITSTQTHGIYIPRLFA
jgi:hypothetical protein